MPPELDRRRFLAGVGALVAVPGATRRLPLSPRAQVPDGPFRWGVASFDPTTRSVLLWTRIDPATAGGQVTVEVATDETFTNVVAFVAAAATAASDFCVTIEADDLPVGTTLWYRFTTEDGATSPTGRTRTLADDPDRLRLGLVSCARYASGGYAVYRALADRDLDLVVHVGDYIYEDGESDERDHVPATRCTTLADYRARYALGRADPDLQALHARHPMVTTWDDHEIAGNAWKDGAVSHSDTRDGPWPARLAAASQAHEEWLPGRTERGADGRLKLWRSIGLGSLAEVVVLDTRTWGRDRQAADGDELISGAEDRALLGADQREWFTGRLTADDRRPWTFVANQVMFHPLQVPSLGDSLDAVMEQRAFIVAGDVAVNPDQWDGYSGERDRVVEAAGDHGGLVWLTGDVHSSWGWSGPPSADGSFGMVELVTPSVTSTPFAERIGLGAGLVEPALQMVDSELAHVELSSHGYVLVDCTEDRVQGEWWYVDPADATTQQFGAALATERAPMRLRPTDTPTADGDAPVPTTTAPTLFGGSDELADDDGYDITAPAVAGGAAVVAAVAGAVALRRRRT